MAKRKFLICFPYEGNVEKMNKIADALENQGVDFMSIDKKNESGKYVSVAEGNIDEVKEDIAEIKAYTAKDYFADLNSNTERFEDFKVLKELDFIGSIDLQYPGNYIEVVLVTDYGIAVPFYVSIREEDDYDLYVTNEDMGFAKLYSFDKEFIDSEDLERAIGDKLEDVLEETEVAIEDPNEAMILGVDGVESGKRVYSTEQIFKAIQYIAKNHDKKTITILEFGDKFDSYLGSRNLFPEYDSIAYSTIRDMLDDKGIILVSEDEDFFEENEWVYGYDAGMDRWLPYRVVEYKGDGEYILREAVIGGPVQGELVEYKGELKEQPEDRAFLIEDYFTKNDYKDFERYLMANSDLLTAVSIAPDGQVQLIWYDKQIGGTGDDDDIYSTFLKPFWGAEDEVLFEVQDITSKVIHGGIKTHHSIAFETYEDFDISSGIYPNNPNTFYQAFVDILPEIYEQSAEIVRQYEEANIGDNPDYVEEIDKLTDEEYSTLLENLTRAIQHERSEKDFVYDQYIAARIQSDFDKFISPTHPDPEGKKYFDYIAKALETNGVNIEKYRDDEDEEYAKGGSIELTPLDRKSFYGKAKVINKDGKHYLQSYNTIVAEYDPVNKKMKVYDYYSHTTARHINAFLNHFGYPTMSKAEILANKNQSFSGGGGIGYWKKDDSIIVGSENFTKEEKKDNNRILVGGLAGVLLGIFLLR